MPIMRTKTITRKYTKKELAHLAAQAKQRHNDSLFHDIYTRLLPHTNASPEAVAIRAKLAVAVLLRNAPSFRYQPRSEAYYAGTLDGYVNAPSYQGLGFERTVPGDAAAS